MPIRSRPDTEPQPSRNSICARKPYSVEMNTETDIENLKLGVQETLDELFSERLIPFELTAYKVKADGLGEYVVPFYDSRIRSVRFSWKEGGSVKAAVRAAVLDHVNKMSGPLKCFGIASFTP